LNLLLQRILAVNDSAKPPSSPVQPQGFKHGWRPFIIGAMQGCGESVAWLFAAGQLANALQKGFYLLAFGIGSIIGMMLLGVLLSLPAEWSAKHSPLVYKTLPFLFGGYSLLLGLWLGYQIAFVKGLFVNWY
jgi:sulfite exporter TauE/SafE